MALCLSRCTREKVADTGNRHAGVENQAENEDQRQTVQHRLGIRLGIQTGSWEWQVLPEPREAQGAEKGQNSVGKP
jgi:hypothetical protein